MAARRPTSPDQLEGLFGQALGLGLLPRLSVGTQQLSIRCSSVHFGPSLSFPVSAGRGLSIAKSFVELCIPS
jgi:hypothetical protein